MANVIVCVFMSCALCWLSNDRMMPRFFSIPSTLDFNQWMLACCAWVGKIWMCCWDTLANQKTSRDGTLHVAVICEETCRQELLTFKRAADLRCTTEMRVTSSIPIL